MKIALLAPFEESVPPLKYGGTELIVHYLTEHLSKKGHEVFLFATGDSKTQAKLIPIFSKAIRKEPYGSDLKIRDALKYIGISKVIKELKKIRIDIIHNHIGWRFLPFSPFFDCPVLTTLHGPLNIPYQKFVYGQFKKLPFVSISNAQRKPLPDLNYIATIYNGIDINQFEFKENPKGDYFAFLGRMSPEKGPLEAILAAKKANVKLKMAAKVDTVDKEYFQTKIKPLIDGKQIEFIGEIKPKEKSDFLKNARGLLAPIQWEEPFGLFFIEAMACGTPVITLKKGSTSEIIENKKTGFILNKVEQIPSAIRQIDKIKRQECRKQIEEKFTSEIMVENYEKIYKKILMKK